MTYLNLQSLVLVLSAAIAGCGAPDPTAKVRIKVGSLSVENAAHLTLSPDIYDFFASGTAYQDNAEIVLSVKDRAGEEVDSVLVELTVEDAGAFPGDVGSGEQRGVELVAGSQSVSIAFQWREST